MIYKSLGLYQIQGVTNEPTGNSEKSEPQMGFEPTTLVLRFRGGDFKVGVQERPPQKRYDL